MKCPACNKTIPENTLKCPYCSTRTGLLCKNCNTVNSIHDFKCKKCGQEILKICPHCNSTNLPNSKKCRKCGHPFGMNYNNKNTFSHNIKTFSQKEAVTLIAKNVINKTIISLTGPKGSGKSVVIEKTISKLKNENYIWLLGKCTSLTQLTPGGLIRDMILNLFNLPNYNLETSEFKQEVTNFLQNEFLQISSEDINKLFDFLYIKKAGSFENLFENKNKIFDLLFKIFERISQINKFIMVVDNFDFIDGFSYEFISKLLENENFVTKFALILMYKEPKSAKAYFYIEDDDAYCDIALAPLSEKELENLCISSKEPFSYLSTKEKKEIIEKSKGNPAFLEQALFLCFDCQIADEKFKLPKTFNDIIDKRLNYLKRTNTIAYKTLIGAAILGFKTDFNLLKSIFGFKDIDFSQIVEYLVKMKFINYVSNDIYEFKNILLWETILSNAKYDSDYAEINTKIASLLNNFIGGSHVICGIIAQNLKQKEIAVNIWKQNADFAASIGDINLYVISQKQCLTIINELEDCPEISEQKGYIYEHLGKLLADYNPKEALEFLPEAVSNAKIRNDEVSEIELLGYLSFCCLKTGNYYGNIEGVDNVLNKIGDDKLKTALIKSSKLEALLYIGNYGEIINTIDNDIMPILDEYLKKHYKSSIPYDFIYETWLKTYLILANALILQGNDRAFEILTILFDIIERKNIKDELFICKSKIALALANSLKGDFKVSDNILQEIMSVYKDSAIDNKTIIQWNLVKIINNIFRKRYDGLREDLFELVTFANNCGNEYAKNILKVLLGKILKDNNQPKQALDIYNGQITYFAKEKLSFGALLTWYLIAETTLDIDGPHAAIDIAQQAIEVAQNPKISNYLFIILLKSIIARAYLILSDYESAKINIENAITLAVKFDMQDILSKLYMLYGKYFQEIGLVKTPQQKEYLKGAKNMFAKAKDIAEYTQNNFIYVKSEEAIKIIDSFCLLHKITL